MHYNFLSSLNFELLTHFMKKLVLHSEWGFHQVYQSRLSKYRVKQEFISAIEIFLLIFAILFCIVMFLIFVNKSSTEGWFLRQANTALDNTNFKYDIVRTNILDLQKTNRDKLNTPSLYGPSVTLLDANIESVIITN